MTTKKVTNTKRVPLSKKENPIQITSLSVKVNDIVSIEKYIDDDGDICFSILGKDKQAVYLRRGTVDVLINSLVSLFYDTKIEESILLSEGRLV